MNEDEIKKPAQWDAKKLAVGNWFSHTRYFKVTDIHGAEVTTESQGEYVNIERQLLDNPARFGFYNASTFEKEEKLALTKIVEILQKANNTAFTVNFNCKVNEKDIAEKLKSATKQDHEKSKHFAQELLKGRETSIVGRLAHSENNLGRSGVVVLEGNSPFAQVDHRTINSLIFKGVKYVHA